LLEVERVDLAGTLLFAINVYKDEVSAAILGHSAKIGINIYPANLILRNQGYFSKIILSVKEVVEIVFSRLSKFDSLRFHLFSVHSVSIQR